MYKLLSPDLKGKAVGEFLASLDDSSVFSRYCVKVYGTDLGQMNRMDTFQLKTLLSRLQLTKNDHILDLGCGIGKITEYISDKTQALMTGVDFATEAIVRAQKRTATKKERLRFIEADINELLLPANSYTCIIAIDSLYGDFIDDLDDTINRLIHFLRPCGQMGILHTEYSHDIKDLRPYSTSVALALKKLNLDFYTQEFTENEQQLLKRKISIVNEMETEFALNGQQSIHEKIVQHSEKLLSRIANGESRRFLYHIKL